MEGKIISSAGGVFTICAHGITYNVFSKGILRFQNKNLVVGDNVIFSEDDCVITDLIPRRNVLKRPKAANIDQIVIVMSAKEPLLSPYLLYKFLSYANSNDIPAVVIFTKLDLMDDHAKDLNDLKCELSYAHIKVFSHMSGGEISSELVGIFKNKVSLLMGQTGVGKSSLINFLDSSFMRRIGSYSVALGRGKHQTKEVILLPFENGFIGDTPGFSSLELDICKEDLAKCFPGFENSNKCFYSNCLHTGEKQCRIKEEIDERLISLHAYAIYLKILGELPFKKERCK
ncbi:MAG: ribosome small subunit-dependent GTPase A [Bacilli bacterium]|jgi:ribosome biogenesis GTPase